MHPNNRTECPVCGGGVWNNVDGKGWPKVYCDPTCRRQADADRRRARAARRRDAEVTVFGDEPLFPMDGPWGRR